MVLRRQTGLRIGYRNDRNYREEIRIAPDRLEWAAHALSIQYRLGVTFDDHKK